MAKEDMINVTLVLPQSLVDWLDRKAEEADTNRSQVARTKLRIVKTMEENSPMLNKSATAKAKQ